MLLIKIWVNFEIIVGIPLLIKAYNIMYTVYILEVLLEDLGILIMESIFLYTNIKIVPHSVYTFHYPITLSILALQLPLTSMTASHTLCHPLTLYMII